MRKKCRLFWIRLAYENPRMKCFVRSLCELEEILKKK